MCELDSPVAAVLLAATAPPPRVSDVLLPRAGHLIDGGNGQHVDIHHDNWREVRCISERMRERKLVVE